MAITISPCLLDQINRIMSDRAALRIVPIGDVLQLLVEAGFHSARFYDVAHDISADEQALFLSCSRGPPPHTTPQGMKILFSATGLGKNIQGNKPVVEYLTGDDIPTAYEPWVNALNLSGRPWVDIPIRVGEALVGVIGLSWAGSRDVLSNEYQFSLSNIAAIIACYIEHVTTRKIEHCFDRLPDREPIETDITTLLETCASIALSAVDGKMASIFEYNWATDRLEKIVDKSSLPSPPPAYTETYASGSHLTGRAFTDVTYRHVVDLKALIDDKRVLVHNGALACHEEYIGPVRSLLYGGLAEKERRYLIRIMNRSDEDTLPFVATHHRVFTGLCSKLSELVEYTVVRNRLRRLSRVAHAAISNITNLPGSIRPVEEALRSEHIPDICLLVHASDSQHFSFTYYSNPPLSASLGSAHVVWRDRGFYEQILRLDECRVVELGGFPERNEPGHLVKQLFSAGVRCVLVVPVASTRLKGVLIAAIPGMSRGALGRMPDSVRELMQAYSAIIGSGIEASESYLTTENARRLIGQIGHEIESPVSALGQNAIAAVVAAQHVAGLSAEVEGELRKYEEVITDSMEYIAVLMHVAVTMATETRGVLNVHFRPYDLYQVMRDAVTEAQQMVVVERRPGQRYISDAERFTNRVEFQFNAASKALLGMVGDPDILRKAFVNVFRNAIKYSLPRYKRKNMVVRIDVQPQTNMAVILIENWGIGVPEDKREIIFKAFQRGEVHDALKAIRGMGLGLYIARRFFAAHGGTIFCKKSEPTLNDPVRTKLMEGWLTVFEVRLPYGLSPGPFDHEWRV